MIYDQQNCSDGKRLYVKHPFFKRDVFKSVRLSEEQICLVKDYLDECAASGKRPVDMRIIVLLMERGKPVKFP